LQEPHFQQPQGPEPELRCQKPLVPLPELLGLKPQVPPLELHSQKPQVPPLELRYRKPQEPGRRHRMQVESLIVRCCYQESRSAKQKDSASKTGQTDRRFPPAANMQAPKASNYCWLGWCSERRHSSGSSKRIRCQTPCLLQRLRRQMP